MKKLLVATSALVAAGSAVALDVTLGGEIEMSAKYDTSASGFSGVGWDVGLTVAAAGESMGWTYGGVVKLDMATSTELPAGGYSPMDLHVGAAEIYMGGDFMGKITLKEGCGDSIDMIKTRVEDDSSKDGDVGRVGSIAGHCVEWTGIDAGGFTVGGSAALDLVDKGDTSVIVDLGISLAGVDVAAEYDIVKNVYDATADLTVGGAAVGVSMSGTDSGSEFDYDVSVGLDILGYAGTVEYGVADKDLMVELTSGCYTFDVGFLDTTELVDMWKLEYDCPLHEGFDILASIGQPSGAKDLAGTVSATVSF